MDERRRLGAQDALWLEMDRPTNLMVVDSLVWTSGPVDWERWVEGIKERVWDRYPVFRSVAVHDPDGGWYWQERPGSDLGAHIDHLTLPEPGDETVLQEFIGSQRTVPLDRERPLWKMFCIDGFKGGSAILFRSHHAIADGIRMVQLAMSLFDATPDGGPIMAPAVRLHHAAPKGSGRTLRDQVSASAAAVIKEVAEFSGELIGRVSDIVVDPVGVTTDWIGDVGTSVGSAAAKAVGVTVELAGLALTNPVGALDTAATVTSSAVETMSAGLQAALRSFFPRSGTLVNLFSAMPGDVDTARKLLVGTRNDATCWTGAVGTRKAVAWSAPLPLDEVKAVARTHHATVNDVLVTCVAVTLHDYLRRRDAVCASVNWMIPVNLTALDLTLPEDLGNSFAIVQLELPTNVADPVAVLEVVRRRMDRIKRGHEAAVAFEVQEIISGLSRSVYHASVDLLANRAIGVLTNVPGPPLSVYAAGQKVEGMTGWAPLSGNQPMCFTIYSYDSKVFVGIACDVGLVPNHEELVDGFAEAFHRLCLAHG